MSAIKWEDIHTPDRSWRTKLIGGLSQAYVIPRYVELFEQYCRRPGQLSFLELGAGNGEIACAIRDKKFDFISRYVASDYFSEGVRWLEEKGLEAALIDAEHIRFPDQSFDAIVCFDVMHHVTNPGLMAREMLRTGRGRIFLTESNGLSLGRKLKELTPGHRRAGERSYTPRQYRHFFNHPGFKITHFEIHPFVFPIAVPRAWLAGLVRVNRWMERAPFLKWQCSNVYIYIEYERLQNLSGDMWYTLYRSEPLVERRRKSHGQKLTKVGLSNASKERVLDVACGEGEMLDILKSRGFENLIGIDLVSDASSVRFKNKKWSYAAASAFQLPFQSESVDCILCAHALHHFGGPENIRIFLNEARRVLRRDGRLAVVDHFDSMQLRIALCLLRSPLAGLTAWSRSFREQLCEESGYLDNYLDRYSEVQSLFEQSSFTTSSYERDLFFFYWVGRK